MSSIPGSSEHGFVRSDAHADVHATTTRTAGG
jgi:hypothetical protein